MQQSYRLLEIRYYPALVRDGECREYRSGLSWESLADLYATRGIRLKPSALVAFLFSSSEGGAWMDEIIISKKWLVAVLVIIGLGDGLLWVVPKVLRRSPAVASASVATGA